MKTAIPKLTLQYFPFANRGEPIRLAFAIGKIPFTHKAVQFADFKELKPSLKFGQLPILEVDDDGKLSVLSQSMPILRYIGKLAGLYPSDPLEACKVDEIVSVLDEAADPLVLTVKGAVKSMVSEDTEWTGEEKIAIRQRIVENVFPKYLGYIRDTLKENKTGWLVGEKVSIADLRLYQLTSWLHAGILDGIPATLIEEDYPTISDHMKKVKEIPEVKAWYESHSAPYGNFEFAPN